MKRLLLAAVAAFVVMPFAAIAQTPVRFSVGGGMSPAVGDLGRTAEVGVSLAARAEMANNRPWGFRGDLSFDQFGGRSSEPGNQYIGLGANMVHREKGALYEFGGLGVYNQRVHLRVPDSDVDNTNLGMQFGVGYNFKSPRTFVEFGVANVFTSGANSVWFPVKFGVRF